MSPLRAIDFGVVDEAVDHGGGDDVVAEDLAPAAERLVGGDDQAGSFVAGGHQLEEQVGGFGFEGDVADLVDDEQRVAAQPDQFVLEPAGVVGLGEPGDPLEAVANRTRCPAWQARIAIPMARWVLPVPGGPRKTTLSLAATKSRVPRWAMRSRLSPRAWSKSNSSSDFRAGNRAARIRPSPPWDSRAETSRCRQADQELLMGPGLGAGPLGQPRHRLAQRGRLQRPGQEARPRRSGPGLEARGGSVVLRAVMTRTRLRPRSMPRAVS